MDTFFDSVFSTSMNIGGAFASIGAAVLVGVVVSWLCSFRIRSSKGVFLTGALMPAVIATVFVLFGFFLTELSSTATHVARIVTVAVALGLLRFRSVNAKAEEMIFLFLSVATGIAFGLGYIAFGVIIGLALGLILVGLTFLPLFEHKKYTQEKMLRIIVPESLDYNGVFDDTFAHYTTASELVGTKTTNMGSMFRLSYRIVMKDVREEKELIDELRTKNGNLEISLSPYVEDRSTL